MSSEEETVASAEAEAQAEVEAQAETRGAVEAVAAVDDEMDDPLSKLVSSSAATVAENDDDKEENGKKVAVMDDPLSLSNNGQQQNNATDEEERLRTISSGSDILFPVDKTATSSAAPPPPPPKVKSSAHTPTVRRVVDVGSSLVSPSMLAISSPDATTVVDVATPMTASKTKRKTSDGNGEDIGIPMLPGEELCSNFPDVKLVLLSAHRHTLVGKLTITSFKLVFQPNFEGMKSCGSNGRRRRTQIEDALFMPPAYFTVPVACIQKIVRAPGGLGGTRGNRSRKSKEQYRALIVDCKDIRSLQFEFRAHTDASRIETLLRMLAFPLSAGMGIDVAFALRHRKARDAAGESFSNDNPAEYVFDKEYKRILGGTPPWRVAKVNAGFKFAPTYPARFVVPTAMSDESLFRVRNFRSKGRVPALCWWDRASLGGSIWRCSQPQVGLSSTCKADEDMLLHIKNATPSRCVRIVDARPYKNAVANKAKGYGYESTPGYKAMGMSVEFLNIHNIHVMRNGLRRYATAALSAATSKSSSDSEAWMGALESTGWLSFVRSVLAGAVKTARYVGRNGYAVIVHCSDGWDRTPQICCLAQMLLDPYYRTISGFSVLVAKEWVSFGHRFRKRVGHMVDHPDDDQRSPTFIQFLDCVWQLTQMFPLRFEFSEKMLLFLADELHSCRFGTFLTSCEKERTEERISERTVSVWSHVDAHRSEFLNPFYVDEMDSEAGIVEPLLPRASSLMRSVRPWAAYFSRFSWVATTPMQSVRYPLCTADVSRNGEADHGPQEQMERSMRKALQRIKELEKELEEKQM